MKTRAANRFRKPSLFALGLALALPFMAAGCKKTPYIETVKQTSYLGLPQNIDHIDSLDMSRLRDRDLFKDALAWASQAQADKDKIDKLRKGMGFDPIQDVNSILMGTRGKFQNADNWLADSVFIMRGNFADPAPKLERMRAYLAEEYLIAPPPFKQSTHPNTDFKTFSTSAKSQYNEKVSYSLNFGFPADDMMVFSFSPGLLAETLDTISGGTPGIGADKAWLAALQRPSISAISWGTGKLDPAVSGEIAKTAPAVALGNVEQYYYSLDSVSGFQAHLGLVCKTIDNAVALSDQIKKGIPEAEKGMAMFATVVPEISKLPGKLTVLPKGEMVDIQLSLTDAESVAIRDELRKLSNGPGAMPMPKGPAPASK